MASAPNHLSGTRYLVAPPVRRRWFHVRDVLDLVNPLQHIPSSAAITGNGRGTTSRRPSVSLGVACCGPLGGAGVAGLAVEAGVRANFKTGRSAAIRIRDGRARAPRRPDAVCARWLAGGSDADGRSRRRARRGRLGVRRGARLRHHPGGWMVAETRRVAAERGDRNRSCRRPRGAAASGGWMVAAAYAAADAAAQRARSRRAPEAGYGRPSPSPEVRHDLLATWSTTSRVGRIG